MNKKIERVFEELNKTIFISTNLEDVEGLLKLNVVKRGIFARGSSRLKSLNDKNVYIHEDHSGTRSETISLLINELQQQIKNISSGANFIWTFRPYPWIDQFQLLNIVPLCWDYFSYLYWSSKLHQDRLLLINANTNLEKHIRKKHSQLKRKYIFSSDLNAEIVKNLIVSGNLSTGGQGMFFAPTEHAFNKEFLLRTERRLSPHIPLCQVAATDGSHTLTYPPSIMIIKEKDGHYDYLGSDFNIENWVPYEIQKELNQITKDIGAALCKNGFSGIYNCDYIFNPETREVYFTEVNPRNSGCSFIIDNYFAERYLSGEIDALIYMPTFAAFYIKLFKKLPVELDQLIQMDHSASIHHSSFCYVYHNDKKAYDLTDESDYLPQNSIAIANGETAMIRTYSAPIIVDPIVPTGLIDRLEKLYQ